MFGFTLGLKGIAVAAAVSLAVGSFSGWKVRDAFCDAAAQKVRAEAAEAREKKLLATIEQQKRDISTLNFLRAQDAQRAKEDLEAERKNQENINATPHNASSCLDIPASRRVLETR